MNLQRKILSAGLAAVMLAGVSMAEARQHGGVDAGAEVHQQVVAGLMQKLPIMPLQRLA